ncbi:cytochrome P450 6a8-like [Teleopsis dalmanni]|uniref:cytochrome P450 6a8-like n=1 Tax=Teleopsis dalmanni TaxID=139649 RepID=UPI0018CC9633|nr:cytochrome P450 6a8-like [Teleopsis dalmanni]
MEFLLVLIYSIAFILLGIYLLLRKRYSYFAERGILHDKPELIFGNFREMRRSNSMFLVIREYYKKYKGKAKYIGFYLFIRRAIFILDLELIKNVLIKDFEYFPNRGTYYNEKDDPISASIMHLDYEKWRNMRVKLTPTFTSGKMKFMFPTVVDVATQLVEVMRDAHESGSFEMGIEFEDIIARYAVDVIGSVAFGLSCNSLKNPEAEFKVMGEKGFPCKHNWFVHSFMNSYPNLARKLGMKFHFDDVGEFFLRIVRETVTYREKTGTQRNDFLNLLIDLKNSDTADPITMEQITAQAYVFFTAGFETSSCTMSFCLYELALNQMVQNKLREEIMEVLTRYEGKFTYEAMNEMKYMEKVLNETMRKYSVVPITLRRAIKDYVIPNTNHVIEKGMDVVIPIDALHHDPELFPNPEEFNPERFSPSEVEKRNSMSYIPFGDGPHICIGIRFSRLVIMIGLVMILRNYRILPTKKTENPLQYNPKKYFMGSKNGIYLKTEKICRN